MRWRPPPRTGPSRGRAPERRGAPTAAGRGPAAPHSLDADGADLLEVRDALDDLLDPVLEERRHPVAHRLLAEVLDRLALLDLALHLVGRDQELVDAHPALVTAVPALAAALRTEELERRRVLDPEPLPGLEPVLLHELRELLLRRLVLVLAVLAERAHEALGEDAE